MNVEPFLRWAGGKRWLSRHIAPVIRQRLSGVYREPFLGAGSMFFAVAPERAALSDLNGELITAWEQVMLAPAELGRVIRQYPVDMTTFYSLRACKPRTALNQAARFIYLNRTCYGGLYRTNQLGAFNVPYGGGSRTPAPLWEKSLIQRAHDALYKANAQLQTRDFRVALTATQAGDVCYLDPTYVSANRGSFDRYNARPFCWEDQVRLKSATARVRNKGAVVVISNVDCPQIRSLYNDGVALMIELTRAKSIGNAGKRPNSDAELLIIYDDPIWHDGWRKAASAVSTIGFNKNVVSGPDCPIIQPNTEPFYAPTDH